MDFTNLQQVYNIHGDKTMLTGFHEVICVITRRGILSAGFNQNNELQTIHFNGYKKGKPIWDADFFEQVITNDSIFTTDPGKVTRIFNFTDKFLLIPQDLYDHDYASQWLKKIHFVESNDKELSYTPTDSFIKYQHIIPGHIHELLKINFKQAIILPLPVFQFNHNNSHNYAMKCFITSEQACITFHNNKMLLWHRIFDYSNGPDITYEILFFLKENHLNSVKINLELTCTTEAENKFLLEIASFLNQVSSNFIFIKSKDHFSKWSYSVSLFQQLKLCV